MKLALFSFIDNIDGLVGRARTARDQGFESIWVPQIFGPDTLTAIAVAGREVPGIDFGTAVVPTYPRHPQMLAQQALTVNQAIDGRLILGIGPSHKPVVEGMWGISFDKPVRHVREYLEILGPLLSNRAISYGGEALTTRAEITVDAPPPKVMVSALGPQLLKVTGRLADGTILWMTGPTTISDHTVPVISAAAEEAGRPAPEIVAGFPICVTDGSAAQLEQVREQAATEFAIYGTLPSYRAMLDREGYDGPADLALIGTGEQIQERFADLSDRGVTTLAAAEFGTPEQQAATREFLVELL